MINCRISPKIKERVRRKYPRICFSEKRPAMRSNTFARGEILAQAMAKVVEPDSRRIFPISSFMREGGSSRGGGGRGAVMQPFACRVSRWEVSGAELRCPVLVSDGAWTATF